MFILKKTESKKSLLEKRYLIEMSFWRQFLEDVSKWSDLDSYWNTSISCQEYSQKFGNN